MYSTLVSASYWGMLADVIARLLSVIFERSWKTEEVPKD